MELIEQMVKTAGWIVVFMLMLSLSYGMIDSSSTLAVILGFMLLGATFGLAVHKAIDFWRGVCGYLDSWL